MFRFNTEHLNQLRVNIPDEVFEKLVNDLQSLVGFYVHIHENPLQGENNDFKSKDLKAELTKLKNGLKKSINVLSYIRKQSPAQFSSLNKHYANNPNKVLEELNEAVEIWEEEVEEESKNASKTPSFLVSRTLKLWQLNTGESIDLDKLEFAWSGRNKKVPVYEVLRIVFEASGLDKKPSIKQIKKVNLSK
jgi:hypothetical protein